MGKFDFQWPTTLGKSLLFTLIVTNLFSVGRFGFSQSPDLNWSEDGTRFWYKLNERDGDSDFYVVDTETKAKKKLFESSAVIGKLSKLTGNRNPTIRRIEFGDAHDSVFVISGNQKYQFNFDSRALENAGSVAPESNLFKRRKRSRNGTAKGLKISNLSSSDFQLYWIDYRGRKKSFGELASGASRQIETFERHVWLVEIGGSNAGYFEVGAEAEIVIDDDDLNSVKEIRHPENQELGKDAAPPRYFRKLTGLSSPDGATHVRFSSRSKLQIDRNESEVGSVATYSVTSGFEFGGGHELFWSPDSKWLAVLETKLVDTRKVHFIESSPSDSLQPKLRNYDYPKPGDPLPIKQVRFFDLRNRVEVQVTPDLIANPFSISVFGWARDSSGFWIRYNQRGHQINRLVRFRPSQGAVLAVVEEKSDTFIHYSSPGKSLFRMLPHNEFLWASERSGWNHLYRYSMTTGELVNVVTSGDWNFCSLEKVDNEKQLVWFFAYGVNKDQDPYHKHFCRVNFDGTNFKVLSEGDGTHEIEFESGGRFFVDTYSRVDLAPVTELRDSYSGELIAELQQTDTQTRFGSRRLTERFVAPGRDGKTDIWGIIHWPRDFDPQKKYPVVENIYAGPHSFHVPKKFRKRFYHQHSIADAGMIVVQIDGMGTAWRSKSFHDVCYKNLRDAGFPDRISWMKSAAKKFPQMDLTRVGIYGGSAGGQNAMAALLWHNEFYKVAVADCGCHDNRMDKIWWNEQWMGWPVDRSYEENSNMANAHLLKGKLMLTLGELDRNVDPASTTQVVRKLIEADKDFEFVLVPGAGHGAGEIPWAARKRINFLREHLQVSEDDPLN